MNLSSPAVAGVVGAAACLIVTVLPGALMFRLPVLRREIRAALPADERWFWQIVISVVWSVGVALLLAAFSVYSFPRLVTVNLIMAALMLLVVRSHLRLRDTASRPTAATLLTLILVALAVWRFTPPAEYVIGGKDPGVYVVEGVNLDRTGTLFRTDPVVAAVPTEARDLFFPSYSRPDYYGLRFMGVFLSDPATGAVVPQFPHWLPASVALGYGVAGIRGATATVSFWGVLGIVAVYLFGARLIGRGPAFCAAVLLLLNVIEVWYGRYPNAETIMQALLFAGLLAFSHAVRDGDRYFGWITGALAASLIFLRFDAYLAIAPAGVAAALIWIVERRPPGWAVAVFVVVSSILGWLYYSGPMLPYFWQYKENLPTPLTGLLLIALAVGLTFGLGTLRGTVAPPLKAILPPTLIVVVVGLAVYALFFRHPGGRLLDKDAYGLRIFRDVYVYWPALLAGIAGFVYVTWKRFWREPAFFLIVAAFSAFFFYRNRVVAEHFWMARRFLPVILPGLLLFVSAAALGLAEEQQRRKTLRRLAGVAFLAFIGWQYVAAAAPVAAHVEYAGAIRMVERLASHTRARDLVIFESRDSNSDVHVLSLPLAYVHGRNVLVLHSARPDRRAFEAFLATAARQYERVLFVASAGTDFLSRRIGGIPLAFVPAKLPEYATSGWDQFPSGAREKDLGYSVYQLTVTPGQINVAKPAGSPEGGFSLDVGYYDELHVLRFLARETTDDRTFRWTGPQSFVAVTGLTGTERELTLVMHDGGRPAQAPPATVEVFFNEVSLGTVRVGSGFRDYRLALPPESVRQASESPDPAQLRLVSSTWSPMDFLGGTDTRMLGVMIDRVEIH